MKDIKKSLIEDINAFAVLASGNQQKYYQDLLKVVEPVKMVSIKEDVLPERSFTYMPIPGQSKVCRWQGSSMEHRVSDRPCFQQGRR